MSKEYDAILKEAALVYGVVYGKIYEDSRKRWPDGTRVRTSLVKEVKGDIVITRNTTYKVEWAEEG